MFELGYDYNAGGVVSNQTFTSGGATRSQDYTFDAVSRLKDVHGITGGSDLGAYGYDAADQATSIAGIGALTYDPAGKLTSVQPATGAPISFGYDARGNRTTTAPGLGGAAQTTNGYNLANQLTSVTGGALDVDYTYDGNGLRATSTSTTTESGEVVRGYLWDNSGDLPLLLADQDNYYLYGADTAPYAQVDKQTGSTTYLHTDLIGSVRATSNAAGAVTSTTDYSPYGGSTHATGEKNTPFGWAGEYTDADTGRYVYLRARYYDPATAQFLSRDPLEDLTAAPYAYTGGNPLQDTDPTGLDSDSRTPATGAQPSATPSPSAPPPRPAANSAQATPSTNAPSSTNGAATAAPSPASHPSAAESP